MNYLEIIKGTVARARSFNVKRGKRKNNCCTQRLSDDVNALPVAGIRVGEIRWLQLALWLGEQSSTYYTPTICLIIITIIQANLFKHKHILEKILTNRPYSSETAAMVRNIRLHFQPHCACRRPEDWRQTVAAVTTHKTSCLIASISNLHAEYIQNMAYLTHSDWPISIELKLRK